MFGSHATQKNDRDLLSLRRGLGRYINTQFYKVINSRKECLIARSTSGMFSKLCKAEYSEKSEKVFTFGGFFISSHFFSLISSFQTDPRGGAIHVKDNLAIAFKSNIVLLASLPESGPVRSLV